VAAAAAAAAVLVAAEVAAEAAAEVAEEAAEAVAEVAAAAPEELASAPATGMLAGTVTWKRCPTPSPAGTAHWTWVPSGARTMISCPATTPSGTVTSIVAATGGALSKARLKRVSMRPVWMHWVHWSAVVGLLSRAKSAGPGFEPVWRTRQGEPRGTCRRLRGRAAASP
jgi:hypothetical protein